MRKIGLCLGSKRDLRDGSGELSYQLGQRLADRAQELRETHGVELHFHLAPALKGAFGDRVRYHGCYDFQKFFHRGAEYFEVWHSFHQHNFVRPPWRSGTRILTVLDLNFFYFKSEAKIRRYAAATKRLLDRYDRIVTISQYVLDDVIQRMDFKGPGSVIYVGARGLADQPQRPVPHLEGRPFFLHISRMARSKNVEALLELAKVWPEKTFVLAGRRGKDTLQIEEKAREMGLANVQMVFDIDDAQKAWLYQHCEAFLFPSLTEGFGLPPIEAMHFGKPAFLSDRTSLPEVGGELAFYWHDFDPLRMRETMETGLARYEQEALGPAIQAHAARYSWDRCAQQYLELYLSLLPGTERVSP
jgi:glycosyltransferase involved in cell wall biosynthesis